MKKIYSLLLLVVSSVSFGQVFSDNLNYADTSLLTANGWTAHSGSGTNAVDVGTSNGLTYTGYSGLTGISTSAVGNAARLDQNGEDVNKPFATAVTTGTLYYSFLVNVAVGTEGYFTHLGNGTNFAARIYVKPSATAGKINFGISNTGTASYAASPTDFDPNVTYLVIVKYDVSTTGAASLWIKASGVPATEAAAGTPEHTTSGTGQATIGGVYLRQYSATQNITLDGILVYTTWFGTTPCSLTLGAETTACNAVTLNLDTYTATIPFTGGNTGTYNLSANVGTIGGDNPSTTAAGNITISNISEGTNVTLTVTGACSFTKTITAPECKPANALPFNESFAYAVPSDLGSSQSWSNANTGDNVATVAGNLNYTDVVSTGNSIAFAGVGAECHAPFTATTAAEGGLYARFLMNVTDYSAVTTDGTQTYFAVLTDGVFNNFRARLYIKKVGTQYQLGLTSGTSTTNYTTTLYNVGDVVCVVIGYDFASNTLKAWFNPVLSNIASATPDLTDTPATAITILGGFLLRQDSNTATPAITVDELRISTTLPGLLSITQNEIAGLNIYPNPVSNGTFFVETAVNSEKNIVVYDIMGKQVLNTTTASTQVNVAGLNSGIYLVKVTEEGKTAIKKLVIR